MSLAIWFFKLRQNIIKRVHTCTQHTFLWLEGMKCCLLKGFKLVRGLDAFFLFFFLFSFSNQLMWSAKYVLAFSFSVLLLVLHHLSNRLLSKAVNSILTESFPYPQTHRSSAANCLSSWRKIFTKPLPLPLSSWNMACVSIINRYSNSHPIVKMYPQQE